jgi:hypothetical protein
MSPHRSSSRRFVALLVASSLIVPALPAASDPREQRLEASVRFLSDDLLLGRGTPGRGLETAALWIATKLSESGWRPPFNQSYLQRYTLGSYSLRDSKVRVLINGRELRPEEFVLGSQSIAPAAMQQPVDIIATGYGIDAPDRKHRDYAGLDLRGKASLVVPAAPWSVKNDFLAYDQLLGKSVSSAVRGAAMTIVVVPDVRGAGTEKDRDLQPVRAVGASQTFFLPELRDRRPSAFGPLLAISEAAFQRLLKRNARDFVRHAESHRGEKLGTISIEVDTKATTSRPANVGGILPGNDPLLRDEWIVVTAHYDHLGVSPDETRADRIYNGADDNASGTAGVVELARSLARRPHKRSILLLLVSGEERGLLGSAYFAANSPIPLDKVVIDLNIDMIGRSKGDVQAATYGSDSLLQTIAGLAQGSGIEVIGEQHPEWRTVNLSDDYHFARRGVPAVEFFTGLHSDYHQVSDEAEKIRFPELARIVTIIERTAEYFADSGERPVAKWPEWFVLEER